MSEVVTVAAKQPSKSSAKTIVRGCVGTQGCRRSAAQKSDMHDRLGAAALGVGEPVNDEQWLPRRLDGNE